MLLLHTYTQTFTTHNHNMQKVHPKNNEKTNKYTNYLQTHMKNKTKQNQKSQGFFIHLMKFEWNLSVLSSDFKPEGRLFQMMGPAYVKLCLKNFGLNNWI